MARPPLLLGEGACSDCGIFVHPAFSTIWQAVAEASCLISITESLFLLVGLRGRTGSGHTASGPVGGLQFPFARKVVS